MNETLIFNNHRHLVKELVILVVNHCHQKRERHVVEQFNEVIRFGYGRKGMGEVFVEWYFNIKKSKGKGTFLYNAVSNSQDCSKHFTLYFLDRPVHSDTISTFHLYS